MTCSIWLSEKDRETLIDEGLLPAEMVGSGFKTEVDMIHMLRVTTVYVWPSQSQLPANTVLVTTSRVRKRRSSL